MKQNVNKVLLISTLCSSDMMKRVFELNVNRNSTGFAIQKFHRQLMTGLVANQIQVSTCSSIPMTPNEVKKRIWLNQSEFVDGIYYHYLFFINLPVLRHLCLFINAFLFTLLWGLKNRNTGIVITDVLFKSVAYGGFFASRLIGLKNIAIITDMPGMTPKTKIEDYKTIKETFYGKMIRNYSGYIYISEKSNTLINLHNKPYIVVEGSVDANNIPAISDRNEKEPIIMYAGGLREEYGLRTLIEAFLIMQHKDVKLVFYGGGDFAKEILEYSKSCNRIEYRGTVTNDIIVEEESKATFLVNPRPTSIALTQFSFPSKTHEYMLSGIATITTHLAGITSEYDPYLYYIEEETVQGMANLFDTLLDESQEVIRDKGMSAREFVIKEKNNVRQAEKMIRFFNDL